jgi:uncharacterized membrane protein (DUF2068 family)
MEMSKEESPDRWMFLIAVFKLAKGSLLVIAAIGALGLLHKDVAEIAEHWIDLLRVDPDNRYVQRILVHIVGVNDRILKEISVGTFLYASLFFTEGIGLLLRRRWAQYFTAIVTGSFIPLELYELVRHPSLAKMMLIALNVAIVVYLIVRIGSDRRISR